MVCEGCYDGAVGCPGCGFCDHDGTGYIASVLDSSEVFCYEWVDNIWGFGFVYVAGASLGYCSVVAVTD